MTKQLVPDYVLDGCGRILGIVLPMFTRRGGGIADIDMAAATSKILRGLLADTRAAARSQTLVADLAAVVSGYRLSAADQRGVVVGLERIIAEVRSVVPVEPRTRNLRAQRESEIALLGFIEVLCLGHAASAVAKVKIGSFDEAHRLRLRLGRTFDTGIDRAAERGDIDVLRTLRDVQAKLTRDLIERGRPLARIVGYETVVPLPAVVLAHKLYQDASRANEIIAENATDHPAFMPMIGRAYSS